MAHFNDSFLIPVHLPCFRVLSDVGAALQQQSNSAKDASIKSTTSLMAADQRSDSAQTAGPGGGGSSSHPALNLQTATTTSTTTTLTANRDKSQHSAHQISSLILDRHFFLF